MTSRIAYTSISVITRDARTLLTGSSITAACRVQTGSTASRRHADTNTSTLDNVTVVADRSTASASTPR